MTGEPRRTCVGCRRTAPQRELERLTRLVDGTLAAGRTVPGRGAWLCAGSLACLDLAVRKRALERALRGAIRPAALQSLRASVSGRARIEGRDDAKRGQ